MRESLVEWDDVDPTQFGKTNMCLRHRAHESELFTDEQLAKLIACTSRDNYAVETMELQDDGKFKRREGETGSVSGDKALDAVRDGYIWYLLLRPDEIDPRYRELVDQVYAEIMDHVPGFNASSAKISILISSPKMHVGYHADMSGQTLWQVRGSKRVYVYPPKPPFLHQSSLEKIMMKEALEFALPYDESFDEAATIFDLKPGEMLHWPLNAPHRVINHDSLNVSFTTEHTSSAIRRNYVVNYANGVLRRTLGMNDLSQNADGVAYWSKLGIAGAYRVSGMEKRRRRPFNIDFTVDPESPDGIRNIEPYQYRL